MIVTKKALSRRTMLRGLGTALALPLLDGMVPALTALAKTAAKTVPRFGLVYVPNGIVMESFTPATTGSGFAMTPILKPIEAFREQMLILTGMRHGCACQSGGHIAQGAAYLTGVAALPTTGNSKLQLATSMDQLAAQTLGADTVLPSLELSLEGADSNVVATCDPAYSCAYLNISWRNATTPMPRETNPRRVFERLFGDSGSTDPRVRQARMRSDRSVLDSVMDKVGSLQRSLGAGDQLKLGEFLDSVRDVEQRLQRAESQDLRELPVVSAPAGIPVSYEEHAKLMFNLQRLAFQSDLTRVSTFMMGRELSGATYPQIGVTDSHHPITHHGGDTKKIADVVKINTYHASLFAYYLEQLKATPDGDGTLLDNIIVLYGGAIGDGNVHAAYNLPTVLVGGGGGQLKGGRHLRFPEETPLTNMEVTVLNKLGVPVDQFGGSTGTLTELSI